MRSGLARAEAAPAVADLIAALEDDSPRVQLNACYALGAVGAAAVDPLIAVLHSYEELYHSYPPYGIGHAAHALGAIGAPAVPALARALSSPHAHVRANAAYGLGRDGAPRGGRAGRAGGRPSATPRRRCAATCCPPSAWSASRAERTLATLAAALQREPTGELRQLAIQGITRVSGPQYTAVPALAAALNDADPYVAAYASDQLCRIGTPPALAAAAGHLQRLRWFPDAPRLEPELAQARQHKLAKSRVVGRR